MTPHGLLFLHVRSSDAGVYVCQTVEHGYVHTLLRISLNVLRGERLESVIHSRNDGGADRAAPPCHSVVAPPPGPSVSPRSLLPPSVPAPNSRLWYKEFLQLIGYGDAQKVEEYCERVWCSDKKRKKTKRKYAPLGGEKKGKGRGDENSHRAPRHTFDTWREHTTHTFTYTHTYCLKVKLAHCVPRLRGFCFTLMKSSIKKTVADSFVSVATSMCLCCQIFSFL